MFRSSCLLFTLPQSSISCSIFVNTPCMHVHSLALSCFVAPAFVQLCMAGARSHFKCMTTNLRWVPNASRQSHNISMAQSLPWTTILCPNVSLSILILNCWPCFLCFLRKHSNQKRMSASSRIAYTRLPISEPRFSIFTVVSMENFVLLAKTSPVHRVPCPLPTKGHGFSNSLFYLLHQHFPLSCWVFLIRIWTSDIFFLGLTLCSSQHPVSLIPLQWNSKEFL